MCTLLVPAYSQDWTSFEPSETNYRQFPNGSAPAPGIWTWYLAFPPGNTGATDSPCPATNNPDVQYRNLSPLMQTTPPEPEELVWGPVITGNFLRNPASLHVSNYRANIHGLRFEGAFGGRIDSTSDPTTQNHLTQAVFFHQNYCYDGGPEFGFARILKHVTETEMSEELTTLFFYYSIHTNCDGTRLLRTLPSLALEAHAACNWTNGGQIEQQTFVTPPAPSPDAIRIWHDTVYVFAVNLVNASTFHIEVKRQGTTECSDPGNTCRDYPVEPWFSYDARQMLANAEPGFITVGLNKAVAVDAQANFYGTMTSPSWDLAAVGINWLQYLP